MKTLSDGTQVHARMFYYLLDWNDNNGWDFMINTFNQTQLYKLNKDQFTTLFMEATSKDLKTI